MKKINLILLGLLYCLHSVVFASGMTSNGGGTISDQTNPWFLDKELATYCVIKSDDYSLDMTRALFEVQYAMEDWGRTLVKISTTATHWGNTKHRLIKRFAYVDTCSPEVDLKILLGVINDDIIKTVKDSGNTLFAFAQRESINEKTLQAKGYIWIAPDLGPHSYKNINRPAWSHGESTYYLVLHELGHTLGFSHEDDDLVMGSDMPEIFASRVADGGATTDGYTIYDLPENYRLNLSKSLLFKSYVAQEEFICKSLIRYDGVDFDRFQNEFLKQFFKIDRFTKEMKICIRATGKDEARKLELSLYKGHPVFEQSKLISKVYINNLPSHTGGLPMVSVNYKTSDNRWVSDDLYVKWQTELSETLNVSQNGKMYYPTFRTDDEFATLTFAYNERIIEIPFWLFQDVDSEDLIVRVK